MSGIRFRLEDLPASVREQVERKLASQYRKDEKRVRIAQDAPEATEGTKIPANRPERKGGASMRRGRAPNKTESEYNRLYLCGNGMYEAITLRLPGGSRYTPDWVTISWDEAAFGIDCLEIPTVTLHEVKGSYRFGSQGRALTAFKEAAAVFKCFKFVWAKRQKNGNWEVLHA
jgi:hypothetical protein